MSHENPGSLELQQRWHGWGSPVGLGVGLLCAAAAIAVLMVAASLYV